MLDRCTRGGVGSNWFLLGWAINGKHRWAVIVFTLSCACLLQIPDYLSLDSLATSVGSILVVGGGFLGSELAVGLASRGMLGRGRTAPRVWLLYSFAIWCSLSRQKQGSKGHSALPRRG